MDGEEKKTETPEETKEGSDADSNDGHKPESTRLIDDANLAAKRLEEANKEMRELVERQEKVAAQNVLGGKSDAGSEPRNKEESPKEYKDRVLAGKI